MVLSLFLGCRAPPFKNRFRVRISRAFRITERTSPCLDFKFVIEAFRQPATSSWCNVLEFLVLCEPPVVGLGISTSLRLVRMSDTHCNPPTDIKCAAYLEPVFKSLHH